MTQIDLASTGIDDLQAQMATGKLTAVSLTQYFLDRIEQIDRQGPALNSILELNPDALASAAELDREREQTGPRGVLHGLPIVLKGNMDTADRMTTTTGSLALSGSIPPKDAFLVTRLRQAGAVILGKANLSEWANFRSAHSISGWSSQGGLTKNPYALDRNPCGSSSGSAVAVAAGLAVAALGTETDGSIVCPAQANGIVGLKPTVGLISRSGIIPISYSQDTAGPLTRTVAEAAVLLGLLVGTDPADEATAAARDRLQSDYTQFLDPNGLKGARIGVARNFFGFDPKVDAVMEKSLATMVGLGAELVDPTDLETTDDLDEPEMEVLLYEFKAALNDYLASLGPGAPVHSLAEIIAFNEQNRATVMPYFGQERMLAAQEKGPLTDEPYLEALAKCRLLARDKGLDAILQEHQLDAIVAPTGGPAWLSDLITGDHYGGGCSSPAAVAGYPHITVPAGMIFGLPVGISFIGGAFQEPRLLSLAYAFEQASQIRQMPQFRPSADLSRSGG